MGDVALVEEVLHDQQVHLLCLVCGGVLVADAIHTCSVQYYDASIIMLNV